MNSVFSAFKSSKSDSKSKSGKKITQDPNSYENLRHLRDIGSSTKMTTFIVTEDDDSSPITPEKCKIVDLIDDEVSDVVDHIKHSANDLNGCGDTFITNKLNSDFYYQKKSIENECQERQQLQNPPYSPATSNRSCSSENNILNYCGSNLSCSSSNNSECSVENQNQNCVSDENTVLPVPVQNGVDCEVVAPTKEIIHKSNSLGSSRFHRPRLSLSGIGNNSMPSVHGRPNSSSGNGEPKKTRLSTHQRNLSLDFR